MFQVKWFNKRKGYGFVSGDLFVHHSDIQVSGYKYLKRGEYVMGEVTETGGKKKLSNIRAPMEGGKLMCEVELEDGRDGLGRLGRLGSTPKRITFPLKYLFLGSSLGCGIKPLALIRYKSETNMVCLGFRSLHGV